MHQPLTRYRLITEPDAAQMEQIFHLRSHAWRSRMPWFDCPTRWEDPEDGSSQHWAIQHGTTIVAAARLTVADRVEQLPSAEVYRGILPPLSGKLASINRLVVDPLHGGQGLSGWLDRARLAHADRSGAQHVVAQTFAGISRIEQLVALGFRPMGEARPYASGPLALLNPAAAGSTRPKSNIVLLRSAMAQRFPER